MQQTIKTIKAYCSSNIYSIVWVCDTDTENIYPDLKNLGINLLLLTQESSSYIPKTHENIVTQINLAKDHKKEIAYNYKVYSRLFPIWQIVSGADEDVVSPGVFAINQHKRITYLNTDEGFKLKFVRLDIIKSLY